MVYPASSTYTEYITSTFTDTAQIQAVTAYQTYAGDITYDQFGRMTQWRDGSGLYHRTEYSGSTQNFRISRMSVYNPVTASPTNPDYLDLAYAGYDASGNLLQINDGLNYPGVVPSNDWTYAYDGLGRLQSAQRATAPATSFEYDGLGNMTDGNELDFAHSTTHPHRLSSVDGGGAGYDANGALTAIPSTDTTDLRTVSYDADGRVRLVQDLEGGSHSVRNVYDFRGNRIARIVNEGLTSERVTFYFGRWFEVTEDMLLRHIYLGDRLIAESAVAAPPYLTLAELSDEERGVLLARVLRDGLRDSPSLYPVLEVSEETAAAASAAFILIAMALWFSPWRVRLAYLGKVRRGRVGVVIVIFGITLTPAPLARPAWASGGGGPGLPAFPVYFVQSDHLGSTLALTCQHQSTCGDRATYRYYRYEAYGETSEYGSTGAKIQGVPTKVDRLFTGQTWDWAGQMYNYGARFYDPKVGNFLTLDPVREHANVAIGGLGAIASGQPVTVEGLFAAGFLGVAAAWFGAASVVAGASPFLGAIGFSGRVCSSPSTRRL